MNGINTSDKNDVTVPENARRCPISAAGDGGDGAAGGLTEQQRTAVALLLLGKSLAAVARAVEVDPKTLYRWRNGKMFRVELARLRQELWDGAAERLRALIHPALDVLEEEVHDEYDRSRVRAAGMILRLADLRKSVPPGKDED